MATFRLFAGMVASVKPRIPNSLANRGTRLFKGIASSPASATTIGATAHRGRSAPFQVTGFRSKVFSGTPASTRPRVPNYLTYKGLGLFGKMKGRDPASVGYSIPVWRSTYTLQNLPSDNTASKYSGPEDVNLWSPLRGQFYNETGFCFCGLPGFINGGLSVSAGNPAPCLVIPSGSSWKTRRLIEVGSRSISVQVQQLGEWFTPHPPRLKVYCNTRIGMTGDLIATATVTNAWQTLGPLTFTAVADGGVTIEVINPETDPRAILYIDNLDVT